MNNRTRIPGWPCHFDMTAGTIGRTSSRDSVHSDKAHGWESKSSEHEGGAENTSRLNLLWARLGDGFNRDGVTEGKVECTSRQNLPWERLGDGFNRDSLTEELVRRPVARCLSELLQCKEACSSPPSNDDELISESSSEESCDENKSCQALDHTVCQTEWPSSLKRSVKSSKRCRGFSITPVPQDCTDDIDSVESIEEFSGESGVEQNSNTPLKKVDFKAQWLADMNKTRYSSEKSPQHQPWDSVVKKKRFIRGCLAERLTQLQARERSASAFWWHNRTSVTERAGPPLKLTVLRMHIECSMIVALCSNAIESDPQSTLGSSTVVQAPQEEDRQMHSGSSTLSRHISVPYQSVVLTQQACGSSSISGPRPSCTLVALFTCETARKLNLQLGCIIRVSPPWLLLPGRSHPTLLSTNFSEREHKSPPDQPSTPLALLPRINATPGLPLGIAPVSGLTSPVMGADWVSSLVPSTPPGPDSLLEAMETGRSCGVTLRAVVQRVYPLGSAELTKTHLLSCTPAMDPHIPRFTLLLQDGFGLFAELPVSSLSDQSFASDELEGRLCMFNDLQVVKRTTRARSPSLFTLIHSLSVFQQHSLLHVEHSDSQAPSFCYLLSCHQDKNKIWPLSTAPSQLYSPPTYRCLRDVLEVGKYKDAVSTRVSFHAWLLYAGQVSHLPIAQNCIAKNPDHITIRADSPCHLQTGSEAGRSKMFVTDWSLQTGPSVPRSVCIHVSASYALPYPAPWTTHLDSTFLLGFRDVVLERGKLFLMDRSLVLLLEAETGEDPFTQPELDFVCPTTQEDTLCIVQGILSEEVQAASQNQMMSSHCKNCSLHRDLISRDELGQGLVCEVLLSCPAHSNNFLVKLSTCQACDVKSYLGRQVGPIHCMVLPKQPGVPHSLCLMDIRLRTEIGSQHLPHPQDLQNVT
uniref:DNA repair-scaffolding protein-like isoform X2 n=1 Tax=Myxine glutinosa TaxID=7769 RepID=UPI00358F2DBA